MTRLAFWTLFVLALGFMGPAPIMAVRGSTPCPHTDWHDCELMESWQIEAIEDAIAIHFNQKHGEEACDDAYDALFEWLNEHANELWVFGSHDQGWTAAVIGGAGCQNPACSAMGIISSRWDIGLDEDLAKSALHEGAHLAGYDQETAEWVEEVCFAG